MKSLVCCIGFVLCLVGVYAGVDIEECDPPHNPIEFRFNNCTTRLCHENFADGVDLGMDFTALHPSQNLTMQLAIQVMGYTFQYPIYDVCQYLENEECPLKVGHNYTISNHLSIPSAAMGYRIQAEASLEDEEERQHVCLNFEFLLD